MEPIQFGEKIENPLIRPSAYAVVVNEEEKVLVVDVNGTCYLPGGGIDPGEDDETALRRESVEETGYEITDFELIGKANQYLPKASMGPMNKLGTFYRAKVGAHDPSKRVEMDHEPKWIGYEDLMEARMPEFLKWAVSKILKKK